MERTESEIICDKRTNRIVRTILLYSLSSQGDFPLQYSMVTTYPHYDTFFIYHFITDSHFLHFQVCTQKTGFCFKRKEKVQAPGRGLDAGSPPPTYRNNTGLEKKEVSWIMTLARNLQVKSNNLLIYINCVNPCVTQV